MAAAAARGEPRAIHRPVPFEDLGDGDWPDGRPDGCDDVVVVLADGVGAGLGALPGPAPYAAAGLPLSRFRSTWATVIWPLSVSALSTVETVPAPAASVTALVAATGLSAPASTVPRLAAFSSAANAVSPWLIAASVSRPASAAPPAWPSSPSPRA